jgi:hypothetical protein
MNCVLQIASLHCETFDYTLDDKDGRSKNLSGHLILIPESENVFFASLPARRDGRRTQYSPKVLLYGGGGGGINFSKPIASTTKKIALKIPESTRKLSS